MVECLYQEDAYERPIINTKKLWDLRRDHGYKLEEVATAVNVVPATISKYENKETKEYNIVTLNKLAEFYGVSLECLVKIFIILLSVTSRYALRIC